MVKKQPFQKLAEGYYTVKASCPGGTLRGGAAHLRRGGGGALPGADPMERLDRLFTRSLKRSFDP